MRNALAVVGAVDIHLAAAIGTIEQAREGSCFAPTVRVASDIPTDFLHKVKGLLVNDRLMGILENCPYNTCRQFVFLVLTDCKVLRFLLFQFLKKFIHRILKFFVILTGFADVDELQQRGEVLFFLRGFIPDVADQCAVEQPFRL